MYYIDNLHEDYPILCNYPQHPLRPYSTIKTCEIRSRQSRGRRPGPYLAARYW